MLTSGTARQPKAGRFRKAAQQAVRNSREGGICTSMDLEYVGVCKGFSLRHDGLN
jgi:hypothetical protein